MSNVNGSMAIAESIYLSVNLVMKNWNSMQEYMEYVLAKKLHELCLKAKSEPIYIIEGYEVISGVQRYPYGIKVLDEMRIFFAKKTGDNYPIYVIVSSQYLHTASVEHVLLGVKWHLDQIFKAIDVNYKGFHDAIMKFSRVDICNHNTLIDLETYILPNEYNSRVVTKIRKVFPVVDLIGEEEQRTPYFRYGKGTVCVRFYNKIKEVCQQQYKGFFIKKWYDDGLIDKFTYMVYEQTYLLNECYDVDFIMSHLLKSDKFDKKDEAMSIYSSTKLDNDQKYDELNKYMKLYKIKKCKEVVNVEYQLRHEFLKTVKIKSESGDIVDYTNIEDFIKYTNELYKYLTTTVFRVVKRDSECGQKRKRPVDDVWKVLQNSQVINIKNYVVEKAEFYREYSKKMNLKNSAEKALSRLVSFYYQGCEEFDEETLTKTDLVNILGKFLGYCNENSSENSLNLLYKMEKQLKVNGYKEKKNSLDNSPENPNQNV